MSEHEPIDPELEQRLRVRLAAAADLAPTFTGLTTQAPSTEQPEPSGNRRSRGLLRPAVVAAAALIIVAGVGGVAWRARDTNPSVGTGSGSCAAVLRWHQRTYTAVGELARFPHPGARLGNGRIPACDDGSGPEVPGESVALATLPGFPPTVAVMALDTVWLAHRADLPAKIRALRAPVRCTGPGALSGTITDMYARVRSDLHPKIPYTLRMRIDAGPADVLGPYASVVVILRVNESTDGGQDVDLLDDALHDAARVTVATRCVHGHFTAQSIRRAG